MGEGYYVNQLPFHPFHRFHTYPVSLLLHFPPFFALPHFHPLQFYFFPPTPLSLMRIKPEIIINSVCGSIVMYPPIRSALDLEKIRSPAAGMLIEQLQKIIKAQMQIMFGNACEMTLINPVIPEKEHETLKDRKFLKKVPKDFMAMDEREFCSIVCTIERIDKKTKKIHRLDERTCRVIYAHLLREILVTAMQHEGLYQKFMLKTTKKNLDGWQELSQRIGNFTSYSKARINMINDRIERLLREDCYYDGSLPDNLAGASFQSGTDPAVQKEPWKPKHERMHVPPPLKDPGGITKSSDKDEMWSSEQNNDVISSSLSEEDALSLQTLSPPSPPFPPPSSPPSTSLSPSPTSILSPHHPSLSPTNAEEEPEEIYSGTGGSKDPMIPPASLNSDRIENTRDTPVINSIPMDRNTKCDPSYPPEFENTTKKFSPDHSIDSRETILPPPTPSNAKSLSDRRDHAKALIDLAHSCEKDGDASRTLKTYHRALHIYEILEELEETSNTLLAIASIHIRIGEFDKAMSRYEEALVIEEELEDPDGVATVQSKIDALKKGMEHE